MSRRAAALSRTLVCSLALLPAGMLSAGTASALVDPTRPPQALRAAPAATQRAVRIVPVLQSVMTGAGRKPAVIISGMLLELGDSYDGMRLTAVTETGAVLTGPSGRVTLALTPAADKRLGVPPAPEATLASASEPSPSSNAGLTIQRLETK